MYDICASLSGLFKLLTKLYRPDKPENVFNVTENSFRLHDIRKLQIV